jgi:predicted transcriptional regulator
LYNPVGFVANVLSQNIVEDEGIRAALDMLHTCHAELEEFVFRLLDELTGALAELAKQSDEKPAADVVQTGAATAIERLDRRVGELAALLAEQQQWLARQQLAWSKALRELHAASFSGRERELPLPDNANSLLDDAASRPSASVLAMSTTADRVYGS